MSTPTMYVPPSPGIVVAEMAGAESGVCGLTAPAGVSVTVEVTVAVTVVGDVAVDWASLAPLAIANPTATPTATAMAATPTNAMRSGCHLSAALLDGESGSCVMRGY
uniref:Minor tail protein n=1 Tax=Mycobacterium phage Farewell TaxID=3158893 RepID=A0AAU8GMR3_9CAUD